ncbi:hypothetical protein LCGC14_1931430 [marine sediment metagenome]|uniref:Aminotransferase class I/classII large domain-containing protein n=1 Tax=marine sediment metagenome TaxID=412755 RepID=A0A0F9IKN5_9ZZZZ
MAANAELTETAMRWTLSNASLTITIDKSNGTIVSLIDVADGFDACRPDDENAAMIGGLRVADELTGETFCDLSTESIVTVAEAGPGPDGSQQVVLGKQFQGAQFSARVTYRMEADCLVWLAELSKREGDDRSVRIVFIVPQPSHRLWGPMHDPFIDLQPEQPIMIRHGLGHGRAVASQKRAVPVGLLSFIREQRCMALALPVEVPNVLVRFMNNADEGHLNVSNSLAYAQDQREYFKVSYDLLGLREGRPTRAGVLLSAHDGQWRAAMGWYAERYAKYFQPDPGIRDHDGVYHGGRPFAGEEAEIREQMKGRRERGVRWTELHGQLERELAEFFGTPDAVILGAAYFGGPVYFGVMAEKHHTVYCYENSHSNLFMGAKAAGMDIKTFAHGDLDSLRAQLADHQGPPPVIATDGVYSICGEMAPLAELKELAGQFGAELFVDDAHGVFAVGPTGRGAAELCGLAPGDATVMGSMSKALGCNGGFICGTEELVDACRRSPAAAGSAVPPAPIAAACLAALAIVREEPELRDRLEANTKTFRAGMLDRGFDIPAGDHPIVPIMLGEATLATRMASMMLDEGIYVIGFSYPVVPKAAARIRVQISAAHTPEQLDQCMNAFAKVRKACKK